MLKTYDTIPAFEQADFSDQGRVCNTGPDKLVWAGAIAPPPIGTKIRVSMNNLGEAAVVGYFSEEGFLGLLVQHDDPPAWYLKQNGGNVVGHIFGPEFKPLDPAPVKIKVTWKTIDGFRKLGKFKTQAGAKKFATYWVGATPDLGSNYAISPDGIGKITVEGITLKELFS